MYIWTSYISNSINVLKYIYDISLLKRRFTYNNLWPCVKNVNTWLVPQRSWRLCRFNIWLIWKTMLCCYASQSSIQAQLKVFFPLCIKLQAGVRSSFSVVLLPLQHCSSTHPSFHLCNTGSKCTKGFSCINCILKAKVALRCCTTRCAQYRFLALSNIFITIESFYYFSYQHCSRGTLDRIMWNLTAS